MKRTLQTACLILILGLNACSGASSTPAPLPTVMLDSAPSGDSSARTISASATLVPETRAQLSFSLSGRVASVDVKAGDTVAAGDVLLVLDKSALETQIASAEGALQSAQADLSLLKRLGEIHERIEAAQGRVAQAQAALNAANANLAAATLTAPFTATVAEVRAVPAENIFAGQVVIVLADLSHFIVETIDLSERDITKVKVGQSATIFVEALNLEIPATVAAISPIADSLGGDVVYTVTLEFNEQPVGLMWGMSAEVEIVIE